MSNFNKVEDFMEAFGQDIQFLPELPELRTQKLRFELIREEVEELQTALGQQDLIEVADALTDILYVVYGAGHAFGINLDKCFDHVHASNMSKLDEFGKPIYREDGKVLKGPGYWKPTLKDHM